MKICKDSPRTVVIVGPTCTGKTSMAVRLCQKFNGSIISADSRQVVKYMDVGTGKVPEQETDRHVEKKDDRWIMDGVDIFGYDLVNPDDYFSAYDFVKYCGKLFLAISRNGKTAFLVGGTGFYIDAVTGRTSLEGVGPDMELRKNLEILTADQMAEKLLELDKSTYDKIDTKNPARLVRAIEKVVQKHNAGEKDCFSRQGGIAMTDNNPVDLINPIFIGLTAEREVLYSRADKWVDDIFSDKLFDEVKKIQAQFPESHRLKGLIYTSAVEYLSGARNQTGKASNLEEAKQRAKYAMHAYIRRQQTWFKRNPEIKWFDITHQNFDAEAGSLVESELHG